MAGHVTMKRPYKSRLLPGLIAATPQHLIRDERLTVLRRVCRWVRTRRYAPTIPDLLSRYSLPEAALRLRLLDLAAEGFLVTVQHGWQPTDAAWAAIGKGPVEVLFSSQREERERQYRMLAYYRQALKTPNFQQMLAYWEQSHPEDPCSLD